MLAIKNTVYEVVETQKYITMRELPEQGEKLQDENSLCYWLEKGCDVAIKVLNSMKRSEQRYKLVDAVLNLSHEEVFFWAWSSLPRGMELMLLECFTG